MASKPLFSPGNIVSTPGALEALQEAGISSLKLVKRHVCGDFGELSPGGPAGE